MCALCHHNFLDKVINLFISGSIKGMLRIYDSISLICNKVGLFLIDTGLTVFLPYFYITGWHQKKNLHSYHQTYQPTSSFHSLLLTRGHFTKLLILLIILSWVYEWIKGVKEITLPSMQECRLTHHCYCHLSCIALLLHYETCNYQ